MLTEHLRQLEDDGLIFHETISVGGLQLSNYGYTEYGKTLVPVLDQIGEWGITHESRQSS